MTIFIILELDHKLSNGNSPNSANCSDTTTAPYEEEMTELLPAKQNKCADDNNVDENTKSNSIKENKGEEVRQKLCYDDGDVGSNDSVIEDAAESLMSNNNRDIAT